MSHIKSLFIFFALVLTFSNQVFAAATLTGYSPYFYTVDTTDPANIILYAGSAEGSSSGSIGCTGDGTTTCDSCVSLGDFSNGGKSCNSDSIYPTLKFTVTMRSDSNSITSTTKMAIQCLSGMCSGGTTVAEADTTSAAAANTDVTGSFTWQRLCNIANNGDTGCTKSFKAVFQVGFSNNGTMTSEVQRFTISHRHVASSGYQTLGCSGAGSYEGFCDYYIYPGDSKVFVDSQVYSGSAYVAGDLSTSSTPSGADVSGQTYAALRVFFAEGSNFSSINAASNFADITFNASSGSFKNSKITSLQNDKQYVFATASVDQGGNATHFVDPVKLAAGSSAPVCPSNGSSLCNSPDPTYYAAGKSLTQSATPRQVFGLLDETKCFVATAAFGSPMHESVAMLRKFRSEILMNYEWGRVFTKYYYQWGPPAAEVIAEHEILRTIARGILWPIVFLISMSMTYGFFVTVLSMISVLAILFGLTRLMNSRLNLRLNLRLQLRPKLRFKKSETGERA